MLFSFITTFVTGTAGAGVFENGLKFECGVGSGRGDGVAKEACFLVAFDK